MSQPTSSSTLVGAVAQDEAAELHLRGRWLVLARVTWLALTTLCVITFAASVPVSFLQSERACTGDTCSDPHLTPQDVQTLAHAGLPPAFFATYFAALSIVFVLVWVGIGALIFWRKSDEPRTLFFTLFLVAFGTIWLADPRDTIAVANPAWYVPAALIDFLSNICFILSFYLFPNGRFVPRWTRWLALALLAAGVPGYLFPGSAFDVNGPNPVLNAAFALIAFGSIIFSQVYRYVRVSTPVERQQTKWVMLALVAALLIYMSAAFIPQDSHNLLFKFIGATLLELALLLVPIAIGISILRYRLWDVDNLINKVLVYGLLTGILGALYFGLIFGLASQISAQPVVLVIATLAIAAIFNPLRRWLQNLIDRRFYRRRYDAAKTLTAFSATLRQEVDLADLREHLLAVVNQTMQPTQASLWLAQPEPQSRQHSTEGAQL